MTPETMQLPLVVEVGVVLTALAVAGSLASRLDQSVIPAYILAGVVIGPQVPTQLAGVPLALVENGEFVHAFAELGLIVLLFFLGLHVSVEQLVENYRKLFATGMLDLIGNFAVGVALGLLFGFGPVGILFVAGMVYISSSAIITKSLIERGWIVHAESDPILGTLVFEDLVIALYLALLSTVVLHGGTVAEAAIQVGVGVGFLVAVAVVGWLGVEYLERYFAAESEELFVLRVLGVATLVASAATFLGVSVGVTAFVVGATVGRTDLTERVERTLTPIRDLFSAVFFFSIGLATDVTVLLDVAWLLAAAVLATTASKLVTGSLGGRLYGLDRRSSLRVGVGMVARGEFSLVLAALARTGGPGGLSGVLPEFGVGYVLVMSVLGTLLIRHEDRLVELGATALSTPR